MARPGNRTVLDAQDNERARLLCRKRARPERGNRPYMKIWQAETTKEEADKALIFPMTYGFKYPEGDAISSYKDREELMAFTIFRHSTGRVSGRSVRSDLNPPFERSKVACQYVHDETRMWRKK